MTPKEKADELIAEMNVIHHLKGNGLPVSMHKSQIKQCALKAIEFIMDELTVTNYGLQYLNRMAYWQEVKQEIEKL